jgi:hypothetical protein
MPTSKMLFSLLLVLISLSAKAQTADSEGAVTVVPAPSPAPNITTPAPAPSEVKGRPVIMSPVPSAKEQIATPEGYVNCFTIEAGWYKDAWVPEHRICQYENVPGQTVTYEGVAWIESYWACTQYTETTCTKWEWKPGRWVKTFEVY